MGTPNAKPARRPFILGTASSTPIRLTLAACSSDNTRRSYRFSIDAFADFCAGQPVTPTLLLEWRGSLAGKLSTSSVNVRLAAIRELIRQARRSGLVGADAAAAMLEVRGLPYRAPKKGKWLTQAEVRKLLAVPDRATLRGKRNYCILAVLLGCALRRYELAGLELGTIQKRDGRWVLADLEGKGNTVRTVAIPSWVKLAIDEWISAAAIRSGRVIRPLTLAPEGLSEQAIWDIVHKAAKTIGVESFGPHDLRRTCAKLCRSQGGELEQIKFMLGHASIQTTERYLGSAQNLVHAVNDDLGL